MSYTLRLTPQQVAMPPGATLALEAVGSDVSAVEFAVPDLGHADEDAVAGKDLAAGLAEVVKQAGDERVARSLAYVLAVERMGRYAIPQRANLIRTVLAELERADSHLAIAYRLFELAGAHGWVAELAASGRLLREAHKLAANDEPILAIGGVARELNDPAALAEQVAVVEERLRRGAELLIRDQAILRRLVGVGVLTTEDGLAFGAVGPFARASDVATDVRASSPYAAYASSDDFRITPLTQSGGDVFARLILILLEAVAALRLTHAAARELAEGRGPLRGEASLLSDGGDILARVEAAAGELLCYLRVAADGEGLVGLRWRSPGQANMPLIPRLLANQDLADVPLIMQSAYLVER